MTGDGSFIVFKDFNFIGNGSEGDFPLYMLPQTYGNELIDQNWYITKKIEKTRQQEEINCRKME